MDSYLSSARQYTALRAQMDSPHKVALTHRDLVGQVVRRCVLDWKTFRRAEVLAMAARAGVPAEERDAVAAYAEGEFNGLHEDNAIRYGVAPAKPGRTDPHGVTRGAGQTPEREYSGRRHDQPAPHHLDSRPAPDPAGVAGIYLTYKGFSPTRPASKTAATRVSRGSS